METRIVTLPEIEIVGMQGLCTAEHSMVAELWQQANAHFDEIAPIAMREKDGAFVGFWGAMSDISMSFLPWEDGYTRGLYLAGAEVNHGSPAPEGWTKWTLPARTWLVTDVTAEQYGSIFHEVLEQVIPGMGLKLSGAVCDYTEPRTGKNMLFFPVVENR